VSSDAKEGVARSVKGLNAFDLVSTHGFTVEPPDQGLCANGKFVIEMVNLNFKVFDSNLNALSGPMILETFFHQPLSGNNGVNSTIQGDPRCVWDAGTGRWFLSQLTLTIDFTHLKETARPPTRWASTTSTTSTRLTTPTLDVEMAASVTSPP
jgi:hypothetical protein